KTLASRPVPSTVLFDWKNSGRNNREDAAASRRSPYLSLRIFLFSASKFQQIQAQSLFIRKMANRHTIVLMQTSQNRATRTFMDYESISQAMDGKGNQGK
ncbi:hypothetical protein AABB24_033810, partial [Solanum stoloniferum]